MSKINDEHETKADRDALRRVNKNIEKISTEIFTKRNQFNTVLISDSKGRGLIKERESYTYLNVQFFKGAKLTDDESSKQEWECGFEDYKWCNIKQDRSDSFNWELGVGPAPCTGSAGPSKAHTGTMFITIRTCLKRNNDKARIILPAVSDVKIQEYCLEFWYHMYGRHMKSLNVYKYTTSEKSQIWTKHGNKGDVWKEAKVRISNMAKGDRVVFEAVRGSGKESVIALDDLKFKPSLAWGCGFENFEWCNIKHDRSGSTYWRMTSRMSFCRNTGPSKAHSGQFFISFESCYKKNNDKARIVLPAVPKSQDYCLEFWYYMKGRHIKQLNVYKYLKSGQKSKVWTKSGDKGAGWKEAKVRISMAKGDKVTFEAVRGTGKEANIALDDMKLKVCCS